MNAIRLCLVLAASCALPGIAAADVREAAQRALSATVAVEFERQESTTKPLPYGAPGSRIPPGSVEPQPPQSTLPPAVDPNATFEPSVLTLKRARQALAELQARERAGGFLNAGLGVPAAAPDLTMTSGTVVSADGLIVTFGLPSGEGRLHVTLSDGTRHTARLAARDLRTGLHLLRMEADDLTAVSLADEPARLGDAVIAGYCLGERDRAIARGIVAATGRTLQGLSIGLLQTDAAVGRMSAGGPLVDESGALVGILAAAETRGGDTPGATLAVPAAAVRTLLNAGRGRDEDGDAVVIERPWLGIQFVEHPGVRGVGVARVFEKSPAEQAGLQQDDVIIAIDGEGVSQLEDVLRLVGSRQVGDAVEIMLHRGDDKREVRVTLGGLPRKSTAQASPPETDWRITLPAPGRILIYRPDGTLQSLPLPADQDPNIPAVARAIRVERSDVEKKLDELSRDVRDLKTQIEELSRQLERLAEQKD